MKPENELKQIKRVCACVCVNWKCVCMHVCVCRDVSYMTCPFVKRNPLIVMKKSRKLLKSRNGKFVSLKIKM